MRWRHLRHVTDVNMAEEQALEDATEWYVM